MAASSAQLEAVAQSVVGAANQTPGLANVFTTFNTRTPKVYADIDRVRAEMLGRQHRRRVPDARGLSRLAICQRFQFPGPHLPGHGAGRRQLPPGPARHRSAQDAQRPGRDGAALLGRLVPRHHRAVPRRAFQPVPVGRGPGRHQARLLHRLTVCQAMEQIAQQQLPEGYSYQWTELAYQEKAAGNTAIYRVRRLGGVRVPAARRAV